MKIKISAFKILFICLITFNGSFGQKIEDFESDFENLVEAKFDTIEVNKLLETYFSVLIPFNQVNQLAMGMKGEKWVRFPLGNITGKEIYTSHIDSLIESSFVNSRLLAYLMIVSSGDKTRERVLAEKMKKEVSPNASMWLGMGLMYLGYNQTSELFKWMAKNNSQAGGFLFPLYVNLPADSLRNTAYQFVSSDDWNERIYAIQILTYTKYSVRTDTILRKAISEWPFHLKGYAIVPAQNLQIGNLLDLLHPLLDSTTTRRTAFVALSDSPSVRDRSFVLNFVKKEALDADVLNSLKVSRHVEMIKAWLSLLQSDKLPEEYSFSVYQDTLLRSDVLLPDLQESLHHNSNPNILGSLLPAIKGRNDQSSQKLLFGLIRHKDSSVRYYASEALTGTCSDTLKQILTEISGDTSYSTNNTFDLAIGCKMDSLQDEAERIYLTQKDQSITANAFNYLAVYPHKKYLKLFRKILDDEKEGSQSFKRIAANGLAQLNDTESVESIIKASDEERKGSDWNSTAYIQALGKIKGIKAKTYISTFLDSKEEQVRILAENLINNW